MGRIPTSFPHPRRVLPPVAAGRRAPPPLPHRPPAPDRRAHNLRVLRWVIAFPLLLLCAFILLGALAIAIARREPAQFFGPLLLVSPLLAPALALAFWR